MTQPLVSVIIPAFNRADSIERAITSVRDQTHANVEILVVDDASTDGTFTIASRLSEVEPRLRVIQLAVNTGAQAARNVGISKARGWWIAFLDSDDAYLPDSLERRLSAAIRDGCSAVHGECLVLRADGSSTELPTVPMRGDIRRDVLSRPGPTFPGMLVERRCLSVIGGLDESIRAFQEWDTAIRLAFITRFGFVPEPTFVWDQRGSDTISKDLRRSVAGYEQVMRKHLRSILRYGGPRVLASHLREAARQHREGGDRFRAMTRYAASLVLWPFGFVSLGRKLVRRVSSALRPFVEG